jgi:hypothetical protein
VKNISTNGPRNCRSLGFARDDKGEGGAFIIRVAIGVGELQIPPLRFAPVGMTKFRVALSVRVAIGMGEPQIPPLRFAPVGMTKFRVALSVRVAIGMGEPQIPPLRYPGFPVELGGVVALHAPFFTEGRTRGLV